MHSHPFADSLLATEKRLREITIVQQGHKALLAQNNIPQAFASQSLDVHAAQIEFARSIARQTPAEGIVACLRAMMQRQDQHSRWQLTPKPALLIAGRADNYIGAEVVARASLPTRGELIWMEHSGHQGFMEEPQETATALINFWQKQ